MSDDTESGKPERQQASAGTLTLGPSGSSGAQAARASIWRESLRAEEKQAADLAGGIWTALVGFRRVLDSAAESPAFSIGPNGAMRLELQQEELNRIMRQQAAFLEFSVFDSKGREMLRMGRFFRAPPPMRDFSQEASFQAALRPGGFWGGLER